MTGLVTALVTALSLVAAALHPYPPAAPRTADSAGDAPVASWPLSPQPEVAAPFAPPARRWESGHRGVDLVGRAGQVVRSALPGRIGFAGQVAGRGVVVVDHGGSRTTYEPVTAAVRVGDEVGRGHVIGTLQQALGHCPPLACLHWGLVVGGDYRDPLALLARGPVRLLPLRPDGPDRPR